MANDPADHALSFDRAAELYERARPSYPDAAVDWLLAGVSGRALDLGAGTGKLTRALVHRGLDCVAVDPSPNMLAQLTAHSPEVTALEGTAESIPLGDASVDAVVVAQAWHWIDPDLAAREIARVLRPRGRLGVVWNVRDESVDWVRELMDVIGEGGSSEILDHPPQPGPPFGGVESTIVDWSHELTVEQLLDLVGSRSNFITADDDERRTTIAAVENLVLTHPQLAGRPTIEMPYCTLCFRTTRS